MISEPFSSCKQKKNENCRIPEEFIEKSCHMPFKPWIGQNLNAEGEKLKAGISDCKTITLLVKIIAPPSDCLRKNQPGSDQIAKRKKGNLSYTAENPCSKEARDNSAVDGNTAFPDFKDRNQIVPKLRPWENNIINPCTDDPAGKNDQRKINNGILSEICTFFFAHSKNNCGRSTKNN